MLYRFRTDKRLLKILRKAPRIGERFVYDEKVDDIEYLKNNIDQLKGLKNVYIISTELNI